MRDRPAAFPLPLLAARLPPPRFAPTLPSPACGGGSGWGRGKVGGGWGSAMTGVLAATVIGYLLGSIPFGLVVTRLAGLGDIRRIGSGNIGATNVLRTGNKGLAALTLALDVVKGIAAVGIGSLWGTEAAAAAAIAVSVGHMFPVWLGFRGGKGVATALGVLLALAWPVALGAAVLWLATRRSSITPRWRRWSPPAPPPPSPGLSSIRRAPSRSGSSRSWW